MPNNQFRRVRPKFEDTPVLTPAQLKRFSASLDLSSRTRPSLGVRLPVERDFLAKLEHSSVFRFFELPPELRDSIYRELLTLRKRPGLSTLCGEEAICHPAILATCRQAYNEARNIIVDDNTFTIDVGGVRKHASNAFTEQLALNGHLMALPKLVSPETPVALSLIHI